MQPHFNKPKCSFNLCSCEYTRMLMHSYDNKTWRFTSHDMSVCVCLKCIAVLSSQILLLNWSSSCVRKSFFKDTECLCDRTYAKLLKYPSPSHSEFSGSAVRVEYVKQISRTRSLYKHNKASVKPVWSSTCFLAEHAFRSSVCRVCVCVAFVCVCVSSRRRSKRM